MDNETVKFERILMFVAVFAMLAFVSIGCASGATAANPSCLCFLYGFQRNKCDHQSYKS